MRTFATTNATALLATTLALCGCGDSGDTASTPGEAVTDRTTEPATQSSQTERPPPASEPAREAGSPGNEIARVDSTGAGARALDTVVIGSDGNEIGTLTVEPVEQGVRLALTVEGLAPGPHAVHFHQHGRCDPPEFQSAGSHYNPHDAQHGMPDMDEDPQDQDHHVGDMLNQDVDDQGRLNTVMVNQMATLEDGSNTLLDEDGSALVIHADADDYESQPSGNAGSRVACAVVSRSEMTEPQS